MTRRDLVATLFGPPCVGLSRLPNVEHYGPNGEIAYNTETDDVTIGVTAPIKLPALIGELTQRSNQNGGDGRATLDEYVRSRMASQGEPAPATNDTIGIPPALKPLTEHKRWVIWRWEQKENGEWTKVPYQGHAPSRKASTKNPNQWCHFKIAMSAYTEGRCDGIGYVLTDGDISAIDIDDCRNATTGELHPWAAEQITRSNSYVEVTPSNEGVRIVGLSSDGTTTLNNRYTVPGTNVKGELFRHPPGRYITITGKQIGDATELENIDAQIDDLASLLITKSGNRSAEKPPVPFKLATEFEDLKDEDLGEGLPKASPELSDQWRKLNSEAIRRYSDWVPDIFPTAAPTSDGGYRVTSASLGRNLQEDLSFHEQGIKDFGVHDMGDPREGRRTPIDIVKEYLHKDFTDAVRWLAEKLNFNPQDYLPESKQAPEQPTDNGDLDHKDEIDEAIALGRTILIVKNKADADYLWSIGIPATIAVGNGKWTYFKDADIVVQDRVQAVCQHLRDIAKRVRILYLEDYTRIPNYTREELDELIEEAKEPPSQKQPLIIELGSKLWGPVTLSNDKEYRFGVDQSKVIDPRKGAWFDFATNEGGFLKDLMKKVNAAANRTNTPPITYVEISKWIGAPVPLREWAVLNRVPARNVTVLSGTGGIGKTILAMMLAAAVVLNREWFGVIPDQGAVIFVSGEEDEQEMHRRFADIVQHLDVSYQDLINGGLHLIDKAGRNAMLVCPNPSGVLITTPFLEQLSAEAQRLHPQLVILDNRNMVYGGNINDPTQVSSFINTMRGFAIDANTAVILILHPSMAGIAAASDSSHQGLAGVMNWHDLPRGRMFFNRIKTDDDKEIDKDLRQLTCKKNNYGPDDENIILRWRTGTNGSGVFVMEPKPGSLEAMAENKKVEEIFLSSLQRLIDQNRGPFSHKKRSNNYAPAAIADLPEVKKAGIKKTPLANAMDRLIEIKKITIEPYGPPSKEWTKLVIADDPAMEKLAAVLEAWKAAIGVNTARTLTHVIEMADPRINPDLTTAFLAVAAKDDGTTISITLLTRWLQKHHRLPTNGLMLSSNDGNEWTLLPAATTRRHTRAIREQLHQCGIGDQEIAQLTSEQAQNIIRERLPKSDYFKENR
jgi:RecA-family ATPase